MSIRWGRFRATPQPGTYLLLRPRPRSSLPRGSIWSWSPCTVWSIGGRQGGCDGESPSDIPPFKPVAAQSHRWRLFGGPLIPDRNQRCQPGTGIEISRRREKQTLGQNRLLGMSSVIQLLFEDQPKRADAARSGYPSTILVLVPQRSLPTLSTSDPAIPGIVSYDMLCLNVGFGSAILGP